MVSRYGLAIALLGTSQTFCRLSHADDNVVRRQHCISAEFLGGYGWPRAMDGGDGYYNFSRLAFGLDAAYHYCAVRGLEYGAGFGVIHGFGNSQPGQFDQAWWLFVPYFVVRGYLGPTSRTFEVGVHVRVAGAFLLLPNGVSPYGNGNSEVDKGVLGTLGLDARLWQTESFGLEISTDLMVGPSVFAGAFGSVGLVWGL